MPPNSKICMNCDASFKPERKEQVYCNACIKEIKETTVIEKKLPPKKYSQESL